MFSKKKVNNHMYGNTGSRKLIVRERKVEGLKRENESRQVSIKGIV